MHRVRTQVSPQVVIKKLNEVQRKFILRSLRHVNMKPSRRIEKSESIKNVLLMGDG